MTSGPMPPTLATLSRFSGTALTSTRAAAACTCATGVPSLRRRTSGAMPPHSAMATDTVAFEFASRARTTVEISCACVSSTESIDTSGGMPPDSAMITLLSLLPAQCQRARAAYSWVSFFVFAMSSISGGMPLCLTMRTCVCGLFPAMASTARAASFCASALKL